MRALIGHSSIAALFFFASACTAPVESGTSDLVEGAGAKAALTINDVSVLFPLKQAGDVPKLLGATDVGSKGPLLPKFVEEQQPAPSRPRPGGPIRHRLQDLKVVAFRVDPCAPKISENEAACLPQIRLVFQTVSATDDGTFSGADANIHAIYSLTRPELQAVVDQLSKLRAKEPKEAELPLSPNPVIERQGLKGAYATGLKDIIKKYVGEKNLVQVAFFSVLNFGATWSFLTLKVQHGSLQPDVIPALEPDSTVQTIIAPGVLSDVSVETTTSDTLRPLIEVAGRADATLTDEARASFEHAIRIQNPTIHSVTTMACAHCHLAPLLVAEAEKRFGLRQSDSRFQFTSTSANIEAKFQPPSVSPNFHSFSYFGSGATINQRVINESAEVVAYINEKMLGVTAR